MTTYDGNLVHFPDGRRMEPPARPLRRRALSWLRHHHLVGRKHWVTVIALGLLAVATVFGFAESIVHHVALAVLAERIAQLGMGDT